MKDNLYQMFLFITLRCVAETDKSYRFLKNMRFMRQHQQPYLFNR